MSAKQESTKAEHKTKKFGKSERSIPHHTQKAKKFYPAEDEAKPKKVREVLRIQYKTASIHKTVRLVPRPTTTARHSIATI